MYFVLVVQIGMISNKKFQDEKLENCFVSKVFLRFRNDNSTLAQCNNSLSNKKRHSGDSIVFHSVGFAFPSNRF